MRADSFSSGFCEGSVGIRGAVLVPFCRFPCCASCPLAPCSRLCCSRSCCPSFVRVSFLAPFFVFFVSVLFSYRLSLFSFSVFLTFFMFSFVFHIFCISYFFFCFLFLVCFRTYDVSYTLRVFAFISSVRLFSVYFFWFSSFPIFPNARIRFFGFRGIFSFFLDQFDFFRFFAPISFSFFLLADLRFCPFTFCFVFFPFSPLRLRISRFWLAFCEAAIQLIRFFNF